MKNCNGLFGRLLGHNYQPIYNSIPPMFHKIKTQYACDMASIVNAMTKRELAATVCQRCGDRIAS